jgi:hypothetical protein
VSNDNHEHNWGAWTPWSFYGSGLDIRERYCQDCTGDESETRAHVHDYKKHPDPYAPVGSGFTLQVCSACQDVK